MADKHLLHKKSGLTIENDGVVSPKLPTASDLLLGEIAVNYATGYETISLKNSSNNIVQFVSKTYVDNAVEEAGSVKEVSVGATTPTSSTVEVFIDTSIDPETVDVYTKEQVDSKIDNLIVIGTSGTSSATDLFVDTSEDTSIEVYTKAQVDSIIQKLKDDNNLK